MQHKEVNETFFGDGATYGTTRQFNAPTLLFMGRTMPEPERRSAARHKPQLDTLSCSVDP